MRWTSGSSNSVATCWYLILARYRSDILRLSTATDLSHFIAEHVRFIYISVLFLVIM